MLILERKSFESVIINDECTIRVLSVRNGRVKLGFDFPQKYKILREELQKNQSEPENEGDI